VGQPERIVGQFEYGCVQQLRADPFDADQYAPDPARPEVQFL